MREAGPPYFLQRCLDGHCRIKDDGLRVGDRQCGFRLLSEPVAPLRLATRLDPYRRHIKQLQGDIIQSGSIAALEFQLDLANRLGLAAAGGPDLALVDYSLDAGCRSRLDRKGRACDIGGETRLQIAGDPVRQMLATLRRLRVGSALGELVLPFAAR